MDYLVEIVGEDSIKFAVVAMAVLLFGVFKAWAAMLVRKADQHYLDHGDDPDEEVVRRVTDMVQADSTLMSMLPRGVVERQVRRRKDTGPPPAAPDEPPPS